MSVSQSEIRDVPVTGRTGDCFRLACPGVNAVGALIGLDVATDERVALRIS